MDEVCCVKDGHSILSDVSFQVKKGEFISIIGANGSGKSMLVKVLAGLESYEGYAMIGNYTIHGRNMNEIRKQVAVILSDVDNYMFGETVIEELVVRLENLNKSKKYIDKRLKYIVNLFQLEDILYQDLRRISNSDYVKVSVAACLMMEVDVLIMDDCLHQLSVKDRKLVLEILRQKNREEKLTILMVTHDMENVMYTDRILVLDKGKIYKDGTIRKVLRNREVLRSLGVDVPFLVDLSLNLMEEEVINHIYLDMGKLVDDIWK